MDQLVTRFLQNHHLGPIYSVFSVAGWKCAGFTFRHMGTKLWKIDIMIKTKMKASSNSDHLLSFIITKSLHLMLNPETWFALGWIVPLLKSVSFQKWADCQTSKGRLAPCRTGFEDSYSSGKYTVSVSGLAFQFPGVLLLNRESKALLNTAAQSNPTVRSCFKIFLMHWTLLALMNFPLVHCRGWVFESQGTSHILLLNSCFQRPVILTPTQAWK